MARITEQSGLLRLAAAACVALCFCSIVVHGKTSRGPKLVMAETAETCRASDRPNLH